MSIEKVRLDSNTHYGIDVGDSARVSIADSEVHGTGRRVGAGTDFPGVLEPMPGNGIDFGDASRGTVFSTTVTHSFGAGIAGRGVCVNHMNVFGNNPNLRRTRSCGSGGGGDDD